MSLESSPFKNRLDRNTQSGALSIVATANVWLLLLSLLSVDLSKVPDLIELY